MSRNSFGKGIEHRIFSLLLEQRFDVYVPLLDDKGIDCVVRKNDTSYIELQIKARSKDNKEGGVGFFRKIDYYCRDNYYYIFYVEISDLTYIWCIPSRDIHSISTIKQDNTFALHFTNLTKGKRVINKKYNKYLVTNFDFRQYFD